MWYQVNVEGSQPPMRVSHGTTTMHRADHCATEIGRVVLYGGKNNTQNHPELSFINIGLGCTEDIAKPQNKQSLAKLGKLLGSGSAATIAQSTTTTSPQFQSYHINSNINNNNSFKNNNNSNNNSNSSFTSKQRKTYSKLPIYNGSLIFHMENAIADGNSPGARVNHTLIAINSGLHRGKIILIGGTDEDGNIYCSDDLYILDTDALWWERTKPTGTIPSPRQSHYSFQISNDSILLFGGLNYNNQILNDIYILTLTPQNLLKWSQPSAVGNAPELKKNNHYVGYCNNSMWVIQTDGILYRFDTVNFKWNTVQYKGKSPITEDKIISCTSYANSLVFLIDNEIYFFDTIQMEWLASTMDGELPFKRRGCSISMIGSMMVMVGGQCEYPLSTVMTKDIEIIDLKPFFFK